MKGKIVVPAILVLVAAAVLAAFLVPITVGGQDRLEKPGSPAYTESLDSKALPSPPPKFGGEIKQTAAQSTPWWPPRVVPPKGAPNVLLILIDDAGYGSDSVFGGGLIPTPNMEKLARNGLRYTMFHSAALCAPTRAALITGRNHHSSQFGMVPEGATGFPGYDALMRKDVATIGKILRDNGYATSWFGKNHNVAGWLHSQSGPFDQWPVGMGFEFFYGFLGGDSSQWQPNLTRNTTTIAPYDGNSGWNLITAMADEAIEYIHRLDAVAPDKPWLVYYAPGATHAPHHPKKEWIEKFKGKFDMGYEKLREHIFEAQKKKGVIPQNAKLTPWPDSVPRWDSFSPEEKKMLARQAEVYAAYMAYTDDEIGRVIQAVEDLGKRDNTLIIWIGGDNGGSSEGTTYGTPNEFASFNAHVVTLKEQMKWYDVWGSDQTFPHYAVGWAWAFDTPFKWVKGVASHFGGTRQGMVISWPARIKDVGGIRNQFHHVIDVVPTILEAAGIKAPDTVDGVPQRPIEGVSMVYTFDKANANAPSARKTQYFEMIAMRGIYHDGWYANTAVPVLMWAAFQGLPGRPPSDILNGYTWELWDWVR
jgi:arylsulfatase